MLLAKRSLMAACQSLVIVVGTVVATGAAQAEQESKHSFSLDFPGAPQPKAEIDLSFGLFNDLFGIADSVLQGMVESIQNSDLKHSSREAAELTTEQISALSKIIDVAKESIHSVQVRVYEESDNANHAALAAMAAHYEAELSKAGWDQVLRVNDGDESVRVSLRRQSGAISNAFVLVNDKNDTVAALIRCDLSPENAKRLGNTCMTSAVDMGLGNAIAKGIEEMQKEIEREFK